MGGSQGFAYNGLTVRVESDEPAVLRWLEEFLTPSFTCADGVAADCVVQLDVDDREYDETLRNGPRTDATPVHCFMLDNGVVRLPLWRAAHAGDVVFDGSFRVFYFIQRDGARIRLLTAAANLAARFALMRVVREFAMAHSDTGTSLVVHGAALAVADRGLVIAGPKGSGKTSLLIYGLHERQAQYVSNDRVVVDLAPSDPVAYGMPTLVTIRSATLDSFPDLRSKVQRDAYDHRLSVAESANGAGGARRQPDESADLTPVQLCTFLDAPMRGRAVLRALAFPRVTDDDRGIAVQTLPSDVAAARLAESLFAYAAEERVSRVFAPASRPQVPYRTRAERCLAITTRVRCYECRLGRGAYEIAEARSLLDRLLGPLDASP